MVATSAATVRVAKRVLFRRSRAISAMMIPVTDFRWMECFVSLQSETAKTRHAVIMRIQVHGWVRKSATEKANIALYLATEGDLENCRRRVRKRKTKISASMLA